MHKGTKRVIVSQGLSVLLITMLKYQHFKNHYIVQMAWCSGRNILESAKMWGGGGVSKKGNRTGKEGHPDTFLSKT